LSVGVGQDGRVLLTCRSTKCPGKEFILQKLDLSFRDLFRQDAPSHPNRVFLWSVGGPSGLGRKLATCTQLKEHDFARMLYLDLVRRITMNGSSRVYPSLARLAKYHEVSLRTIQRALNVLKSLGLIEWIRGHSGGRSNEYAFLIPPWLISSHESARAEKGGDAR
jgi:hypothetical protein